VKLLQTEMPYAARMLTYAARMLHVCFTYAARMLHVCCTYAEQERQGVKLLQTEMPVTDKTLLTKPLSAAN
jgi:hypothetical protein